MSKKANNFSPLSKDDLKSSTDLLNQISNPDNSSTEASEPSASESADSGFNQMNLSKPVLKSLNDIGYEIPTSIQSLIIPHIMAGRDVVGQAQTGTGKTAAFALPLLSRIDIKNKNTQVLVITPTRELAIQVAESFKSYAAKIKDFHVMPIYGGQSYDTQLKQLKRGLHVVVGTPGRLIDHLKRGTLNLSNLSCLVLDEADEMLKMGFIDDVKLILEQTPDDRQMALFSATMPPAIRAIAKQYLKEPEEVTIQVKTMAADTIHQRFWMVKGTDKLDALTRILEAEDFDAILIFVRTKTATVELAEKLEARGYATEALNGDIAQKSRERTIERFKNGKIDIVVATDVAARGLDVERISHVINYDIPTEAESYIHRIGRTGRAGRSGEAILFVSPREMWMLRVIEKTTRQKIEIMNLPTTKVITDKRIADFKQRITNSLTSEEIPMFRELLNDYQQEHNVQPLDIAAALAIISNEGKPTLFPEPDKNIPERSINYDVDDIYLNKDNIRKKRKSKHSKDNKDNSDIKKYKTDSRRNETEYKKNHTDKMSDNRNTIDKKSGNRKIADKKTKKESAKLRLDEKIETKTDEKIETKTDEKIKTKTDEKIETKTNIKAKSKKQSDAPLKGMERFSLDVGYSHGVRVNDIVGAIANEAGLEGKFINNIVIQEINTTVDLPEGMPDTVFKLLKKARVAGRKLNITKVK